MLLKVNVWRRSGTVGLLLFAFSFAGGSSAQTFNSGSTGADGALNLTTPGTIIFDPNALGLHPVVPNVFNFTTINIGAGVTVRLTSKALSGPVYWLAQGDVTINGTVDLSGENGSSITSSVAVRVPAAGGAGGYDGGVGGISGIVGAPLARPGNGPGGGSASIGGGPGVSAVFTGSEYLIPLIGGSGGGGGASTTAGTFGAGGGAGGGAILIATSTSITIHPPGLINANGGAGGNTPGCQGSTPCGGNGSGGKIRLIASTVSLSGDFLNNPGGVKAVGGSCSCGPSILSGGSGLVRVETFTAPNAINTDAFRGTAFILSTPLSPVVPLTPPSSLRVTSLVTASEIIPINANPFSFPDAVIDVAGPVTINVQAQYIPTGTIPNIIIMSENGPDQTVNCSPLTGTLQLSTCSAQITFPTGGSRGFVKATWTQ